jgi:hypothetical protein
VFAFLGNLVLWIVAIALVILLIVGGIAHLINTDEKDR